MNLIQFLTPNGAGAVGAIEGGKAHMVLRAQRVYTLAAEAAERGIKLKVLVARARPGKERSTPPQSSPRAACWPR